MQSEPGIGTTFKIYLPSMRSPSAAETESDTSKAGVRGGETLLLVEDEDLLRNAISDYLTSLGYRVLTANDGVDAVELAERTREPIHLLLTDVVMPRMSGLDAAQGIRRSHPEAKPVFMSGYSKAFVEDRRLRSATVLQKPVSLNVLAETIRKTLEDHL